MNFLPAIPQMTQQNQGTGYGDWQQYAGYNRTNPFGGFGGVAPKNTRSNTGAVPAPVVDKSTQPDTSVDYSIAPQSPMGNTGMSTMGASLDPSADISKDIFSAFGVMK